MSASYSQHGLSNGVDMKMRCKKARKNISLAMDFRLDAGGLEQLQAHLRACPSCRSWQQEQIRLLDLIQTPRAPQPSPGFFAGLQDRIDESGARSRFFVFSPASFRPALLRAAMILLLMLSTAAGFFLGGPLLDPAPESQAAAFNQTLNLDAFADLPVDSFGAVYDRLLQGELE